MRKEDTEEKYMTDGKFINNYSLLMNLHHVRHIILLDLR